MPKKTTILIIILAFITGLLIFLAVKNDQTQNRIDTTSLPTSTITPLAPFATLSFSVPSLDLTKTKTSTQSVDIMIDTKNKPVFGAQIELSYDPKVFSNVTITPSVNPFFGKDATVLLNSVDPTQGRVSYAVGLSANRQGILGKGTIATLSFTANKFIGISNSSFIFLPKSTVTTLKAPGSVLENTIPLSVILASGEAQTIPTMPTTFPSGY